MDRSLSGATNPTQCGPGTNGNKGVFCIQQSSRNYWNLNIRLFNVICRIVGSLPLRREAIGVYCSSSRLGPASFKGYFQLHWLYSPKEMSSSEKCTFFSIGSGFRCILLMCLSVPFLIIPSCCFKVTRFQFLFSRHFIYLFDYILWLMGYYLLVRIYQLQGMFI